MSDINYSITYRIQKGFLNANVAANGVTALMSDAGMLSQTLTLSTNAVNISTANLGSVGIAFLQNLSTATQQTASIGIDEGGSFVGFATLRPGEPAIMRLTGSRQYQAIGVTGARLRVDITEG